MWGWPETFCFYSPTVYITRALRTTFYFCPPSQACSTMHLCWRYTSVSSSTPHPLFTMQTYTQNALHRKNKKKRKNKPNDTGKTKSHSLHPISEFMNALPNTIPTPARRDQQTKHGANKKGKEKNSAYNQTGLTLSQTRSLGSPPLAEFACVGLHLFECVRACSALFTVKRMKCQIVLHL